MLYNQYIKTELFKDLTMYRHYNGRKLNINSGYRADMLLGTGGKKVLVDFLIKHYIADTIE